MMTTLTCPHCAEAIDFESTLVHQIKHQLTEEQTQQFAEQRRVLDQRENAVKTQQQTLDQRATEQQEEVQRLLNGQRTELTQHLKKQIRAEQAAEVAELNDELAQKSVRIRALQKQESDLRREQRQLEEQRDAMALDVAKQVQAERHDIEQKATQKVRNETQFHSDQ